MKVKLVISLVLLIFIQNLFGQKQKSKFDFKEMIGFYNGTYSNSKEGNIEPEIIQLKVKKNKITLNSVHFVDVEAELDWKENDTLGIVPKNKDIIIRYYHHKKRLFISRVTKDNQERINSYFNYVDSADLERRINVNMARNADQKHQENIYGIYTGILKNSKTDDVSSDTVIVYSEEQPESNEGLIIKKLGVKIVSKSKKFDDIYFPIKIDYLTSAYIDDNNPSIEFVIPKDLSTLHLKNDLIQIIFDGKLIESSTNK